MAQFSLDIDPEALRKAARRFGEAEEYLRTKAATVSATPEEIGGDWTGSAATSVKAEMTSLGGLMSGGDTSFASRLRVVQQALDTLAGHYETAQTDLAAINSTWSSAQTEYDDTPAPPDGGAGQSNGGGTGGGETPEERRDRKQGAAQSDFDDLKEQLRQRTRECGEELRASPPTVRYGYYGSTPGYSTDEDILLDLLTLTKSHLAYLDDHLEEDAEVLSNLAEEGGEIPEDVAERLALYSGDPDYAARLLGELGIEGQARLMAWAQFPDSNSEDWDDAVVARQAQIGPLFGAASETFTFDQSYLERLQEAMEDEFGDGVVPGPEHGAARWFVPLMQHGAWDREDLVGMADLLITGDPRSDTWMNGYRSVDHALVEALANHPEVATDYFGEHRDEFYETWRYADDPEWDDAVTRFLESATVALATDEDYADRSSENAEWVLEHVAGDEYDNWDGDERRLFGNIVGTYVQDLSYTVGSPIDPGSVDDPARLGIESTTDQWNKFIAQAVQDDQGLAMVATALTSEIERIRDLKTDQVHIDGQSGNDPTAAADASGWDDYTIGALQSIFQNAYAAEAERRDTEAEELEGAISGILDQGVEWAFDPKGIPKDLAQTAIKGLLGLAVDSAVDPDKMPPLPDGFDQMRNYADNSVNALRNDPPFQPYQRGDVTYTGDPAGYSGPGHDFLQYINEDTGSIDYESLRDDPAAWNAFNEWLHDPAVAYNQFPQFQNSTVGALRGGDG